MQHKGACFLLAVCADALKLRIKQPHTLIVDRGGDLYGTCMHISARQHLYGLALVRCGEFAVKPKLRVLRQRAKALAARKIPAQAARPTAAAALDAADGNGSRPLRISKTLRVSASQMPWPSAPNALPSSV